MLGPKPSVAYGVRGKIDRLLHYASAGAAAMKKSKKVGGNQSQIGRPLVRRGRLKKGNEETHSRSTG